MLRSALGTLLLIVEVRGALAAGINLTPVLEEYQNDGFTFRQLAFKDDKRKVTLQLPNGWSYRGGAARLQLMPGGDNKFAEAVIEALPLEAPVQWDAATPQNLERQTLAGVPPGSQDVAVVSLDENPVLLGGNPSFEVVVTYKMLGKTFQRSDVYVNCPHAQLIFRLSAPKSEFDPLNAIFRRAVLSWQWVAPAAAR